MYCNWIVLSALDIFTCPCITEVCFGQRAPLAVLAEVPLGAADTVDSREPMQEEDLPVEDPLFGHGDA